MSRWTSELPPHWQRFGTGLALMAAGGALLLLAAPDLSGLFLFAVYSAPSNSVIPIPHEPGLLLVAQYYHPTLVAAAGTVGTVVVSFADYDVVERVFRHPRMKGAKESRIYRWSERWLMRYPFWTIVLFAVTPLPVYAVRVLAPASGYPVWRYAAAMAVGRYPRYLGVAWIGHVFELPGWFLLALFVVMFLVSFAYKYQAPIRRRLRSRFGRTHPEPEV